jgi:hypothetical protein
MCMVHHHRACIIMVHHHCMLRAEHVTSKPPIIVHDVMQWSGCSFGSWLGLASHESGPCSPAAYCFEDASVNAARVGTCIDCLCMPVHALTPKTSCRFVRVDLVSTTLHPLLLPCSSKEVQGGGSEGNHGRKRLPLGHLRAVLLRAGATAQEIRSLHGLASALLKNLGATDGRGKLPEEVMQQFQQQQK